MKIGKAFPFSLRTSSIVSLMRCAVSSYEPGTTSKSPTSHIFTFSKMRFPPIKSSVNFNASRTITGPYIAGLLVDVEAKGMPMKTASASRNA